MTGLRNALMLLWGMSIVSHAAAEPARVALHPLVVVGGDDAADSKSQALLVSELKNSGVELVDSAAVLGELSRIPNRSCLGNDECLGRLAKATGAQRAVLVTLSPYSPQLILTGRMVSAEGKVLAALEGVSFPKSKPVAKSIEAAMQQFVPQLQAPKAVTAPEVKVEVQVPQTPTPASPPEIQEQPHPGAALRTAAWVSWSAAALALGGSGYFAWSAQQDAAWINQQANENGNLPPERYRERYRQGQQNQNLANVLLVAGGAAAAAGGLCWLLAPAQSISVQPAGAGVSVSGRF